MKKLPVWFLLIMALMIWDIRIAEPATLPRTLTVETVSFAPGPPPIVRLYLTERTAVPASGDELAVGAREAVCAFLRENPELLTALPVRWEAYQWVSVETGGFEPAVVGYGEIQDCVRRTPA